MIRGGAGMGIAGKIAKWALIALLLAVTGVAGWLFVAPPALIQVATAYSAKIVCSNHFLADRDAQSILTVDVQAPGHPLLGYVTVDVNNGEGTVTARLLGLFAPGRAVYREGLGCTTVPAGAEIFAAPAVVTAPAANLQADWPQGERVEGPSNPAIDAILADDALAGSGMRAIVVAHNGRIVGERYGEGFASDTPLLGWSMSKTVTAAIIGTLVREGMMSLDQDGLFEEWTADERGEITLADLMAMSSGLEFNEDYGDVTDVTRMLYLQPDMAAFAYDKPLASAVGETFSYSSGTTVLLSHLWQQAFDDAGAALAWPRKALFGPLGMTSAVLEADAAGTLVGSSYIYATARDWVRFGEFLRNDGIWQGREILPEGFVRWMREEAPASQGTYGRGQLWLQGPGGDGGANTDHGLPEDTFWLRGHDGQTVAVIPSQRLVVARMGLTPSRLEYRPQGLVAALVSTLSGQN
jgi:CubicO group peptidase (beta-lactamase class C family)